MTASIAERVAAGAAWLDENRPGWVDRIDMETLDLAEPCRCVLGQEYGEYGRAPLAARIQYPDGMGGYPVYFADRYGFDVDDDAEGDAREEYRALTVEWRRLVTARRLLTS